MQKSQSQGRYTAPCCIPPLDCRGGGLVFEELFELLVMRSIPRGVMARREEEIWRTPTEGFWGCVLVKLCQIIKSEMIGSLPDEELGQSRVIHVLQSNGLLRGLNTVQVSTTYKSI